MQTKNPIFDDISKIANGALGFAQTMGEEAKTFWQSKIEQTLLDLDLVRRDEYENALDRLKAVEEKLAALEAKLSDKPEVKKTGAAKTTAKTVAKKTVK